MKIMHINCADYGSTGKIIFDICNGAKEKGYESVICVPEKTNTSEFKTYQTSFKREQGIYRRICFFTGLQFGFAPISTIKIISAIKKEKPDIVHLHSINGYMVNIYKLLNYLKKKDIATVITLHAEFIYTGSCSYTKDCIQWKTGCKKCPYLFFATASLFLDRTKTAWKKMHKCLHGFKRLSVNAVSPWVKERAEQSAILDDTTVKTIKNGVNTNIFKPTNNSDLEIIKKIPPDHKIILHVTANFTSTKGHTKGGSYVLDIAEKMKDEKVTFVVVGPCLKKLDVPDNVILVGSVSDQTELAKYYSVADLLLLTSFRETYSMPVAESLSCGTPVVGFYAGGPESIAIKKYSQFVEYSNTEKLIQAIQKMKNIKSKETFQKISRAGQKEYSCDKMVNEYLDIYNSLL